ncbi:unnamed protein product, partial [Porites lobata]
QQKSANTNKKTATDMNTFLRYMEANSMKNGKIESLPAPELDHLLSKFCLNARKKNGEEYEPAKVSSFQRSIQRYLSEKKYPFNILKDNEFEKSRKVLAAKRKSLRGTKTRHGQERGHQRAFQPKIYATNTASCLVSFYKKFRSHRPVQNERTRIIILLGGTPRKNEMGKFLSTAAKNAGLHKEGKKVTNHSVRKPCISRLLDADVPENFVAQLSGHKSSESL